MAFWYNVITHEVQTDENRSRAQDVLGPYDTEEEARHAVAAAKAKTEQWDREDAAWDGDKD